MTAVGGPCCFGAEPSRGMQSYMWYPVVLGNGTGWGFICLSFPASADPALRSPLPPGWRRGLYGGDAPASLEFPVGQILPGTNVVMRYIGSGDKFFVLAADGGSWGFGHFQEVTPVRDLSLETAALTGR